MERLPWESAGIRGQHVERLVFIDVVSFDWNCPKYIPPRYSIGEVEALAEPLRKRIAELEAQLRAHNT